MSGILFLHRAAAEAFRVLSLQQISGVLISDNVNHESICICHEISFDWLVF